MYIKVDSNNNIVQFPYTMDDLRNDNKNVSFPKELSQDILDKYNMKLVFIEAQPDYNQKVERPVLNNLPEYINGQWIQKWYMIPITNEEWQSRIKDNIEKLWNAANEYQMSRISGGAITLAERLFSAGNAKGIAIDQWMWSHWQTYYTRKEFIASGNELTYDMLDFSVSGEMPHSVPELMIEWQAVSSANT